MVFQDSRLRVREMSRLRRKWQLLYSVALSRTAQFKDYKQASKLQVSLSLSIPHAGALVCPLRTSTFSLPSSLTLSPTPRHPRHCAAVCPVPTNWPAICVLSALSACRLLAVCALSACCLSARTSLPVLFTSLT